MQQGDRVILHDGTGPTMTVQRVRGDTVTRTWWENSRTRSRVLPAFALRVLSRDQ